MHSLDIIHGNINTVLLLFLYVATLVHSPQRNVMVDDNGVARLGGLGSAFALSLPSSYQSDLGPVRPPRDAAPELITPHAFGLVHVRITKATDMFDFGTLTQEVDRSLLYLLLSGHSSIYIGSRSSPESLRSPEGQRQQQSSRCSTTTDHPDPFTTKCRIACGK